MNWIFNKRLDLVCFIAIPLTALLLRSFASEEATLVVAAFWMGVLFDNSHIFGSIFRIYGRVYGDGRELKKYFKFYILLPLGIAIFVYSFYRLAPERFFLSFFSYAAITHFLRQQYGWMRLSLRNSDASSQLRSFFTVAVYIFTFIPILLMHLTPNEMWAYPNDLFLISQVVAWLQLYTRS
jgi:hypothetical protein